MIVTVLSAVSATLLPTGRADAAPRLYYVAAGDSFSSGTGLGSATNDCDRDRYAYGPRAARDILTSYPIELKHVACAGATTTSLWETQLGAVTSTTNTVSLTIGGNDIKFAAKVKGCYFGTCGADVFSLKADDKQGSQTWDQLHGKLVTTYVNLRRRMTSGGHLYVLTYPIPFSRHTSSCQGFSSLEQNAANALVTRLDDAIYRAVRRANELLPSVHGRAGNVHFVGWRTGTRIEGGYTIPSGYAGAGTRFATYTSPYGLCNTSGNTPHLNGYVSWAWANPDRSNSFHPNSTGYWRGAVIFANAVKRYQP